MSIMRAGLAFAAALAAAASSAQKTAAPVSGRYVNPHEYVTLEIPDPASGRKPTLAVRAHRSRFAGRPSHVDAKNYVWDKVGRVGVPSSAFISEPTESVLLVGTLGETGVGVGQLEVRSFAGRVLADIDLRAQVPDLDKKAADWAKADADAKGRGPAPWVVEAKLLPDGILVKLTLVGGSTATVNLQKLTATVAPLPAKP